MSKRSNLSDKLHSIAAMHGTGKTTWSHSILKWSLMGGLMTVSRWPGEVCKRCGRRNVIGFEVPDAIWNAVVNERWNILCPACFDDEAERAGVEYHIQKVWTVSWSDARDAQMSGSIDKQSRIRKLVSIFRRVRE